MIFTAACDICFKKYHSVLCYSSYIMAYLPVRGDNPQALVSGLSHVHMDKTSILYDIKD